MIFSFGVKTTFNIYVVQCTHTNSNIIKVIAAFYNYDLLKKIHSIS